MSMGIGGADPFKSHASNSDAGGGLNPYIKKVKKQKDKKDENPYQESNDDDEDIEIDIDDDFLL